MRSKGLKSTSTSKPRPSKTTGKTVPLTCPHCHHEQQVLSDGLSIFCDNCHNLVEIQEVLHPKAKQTKAKAKTVPLICPHCQHEQQVQPDGLSIFCKNCHEGIDIQQVLHPKAKVEKQSVKTVPLTCPHCQHEQQVRPDGLSIFCKKCHNSIEIQQILHPTTRMETKPSEGRSIHCFRCQIELIAPLKAQSVMCKKCGYRNDLQDYHIKSVLSRDLETHGTLQIEKNGTVLNSTAKVKSAAIAGKFIGKLMAQEVHLKTGANFEGGLTADALVLESNALCNIKKEFTVKRIIIAGQYHGNIKTSQFVELKKTARFIGSIVTNKLIIEEGASLIGDLAIGTAPSKTTV
jgi:cytoskeletal protein CcmA (bactofilin family)/DNA-directed RNA polymerase subunit M/transcription elongation factor TFIIS